MNQTEAYQGLFDDFSQFRGDLANQRLRSYKILVSEYFALKKTIIEKDSKITSSFNPLKLFNVSFDENTHSNILAWLFDPYETHSQGDLFFKAFLDYFNYEVTYSDYDYQVRREFSGNEAIIDILVYGKEFIFYIENKTISPEGQEQTNREYRDMIRLATALNINDRNAYPIFLSPYGQRPLNDEFRPISYLQISYAFKRVLSNVASDYVRSFLSSWLSIASNIGRV
jgi:hypothetical protein